MFVTKLCDLLSSLKDRRRNRQRCSESTIPHCQRFTFSAPSSSPVFIVEDHPETLSFVVAIDDQIGVPAAWQVNNPAALTARRQYVTAVVR